MGAVEASSAPMEVVFVLGMFWVTDCLAEVEIAGRAADVFGGTGTFAVKAGEDGEMAKDVLWEFVTAVFQCEFMLPAVAKVVEVVEFAALSFDEICKAMVAFFETIVFRFWGFSVLLFFEGEFVKVAVAPTHYDLDDVVQSV